VKVAERDLDGVYDLVGYDFGKSPYYKQQVATGTDASYIRFGDYFWAVTTGPPSGPGLFSIGMYDYFVGAGGTVSKIMVPQTGWHDRGSSNSALSGVTVSCCSTGTGCLTRPFTQCASLKFSGFGTATDGNGREREMDGFYRLERNSDYTFRKLSATSDIYLYVDFSSTSGAPTWSATAEDPHAASFVRSRVNMLARTSLSPLSVCLKN
jgi:hypothetical protein